MNITVKVKTRSPKPRIESFGGNRYLAYVSAEPENNEANLELVKMLSKYFGVPPANVRIKFGKSGDEKLVEIG